MSDPPLRAHRRHEEGRARRRTGWLLLGAIVALGGVAFAVWYSIGPDPTTSALLTDETTETSTAPARLPRQCADALALADILASHVGPLAEAANDHVDVMERLELYLEGKPGGIDGDEAYRRGARQMYLMAEHGPDAAVQVRRFAEVRRACPLR